MLPPQDRNQALEIRPLKVEKDNEDDIYDDYTLAHISGVCKDYVNSSVNNPSGPNDKPVQKKLIFTDIITICLIVVAMLGDPKDMFLRVY